MTIRESIYCIGQIARRETLRIMSRPIYLFGMIVAPVISMIFFLSLMHEGLPTNLPIAVVDLDDATKFPAHFTVNYGIYALFLLDTT